MDLLYHAASAALCRRHADAAGTASRGDADPAPPALLVHGYASTELVWTPLRRALAEAGFGHIISLTYNSFAADPDPHR